MAISTINQNGLNAPLTLTSPVLTTPNLGTPSAINLSNATALPRTALPTGSILQVVTGTYDSTYSSNSNSFFDLISLSITPTSSSSKILVSVNLYAAGYGSPKVLRNAVEIVSPAVNYALYYASPAPTTPYQSGYRFMYPFQAYDSPATTSSTTYKLQVQAHNGSAYLVINPDTSNNYNTTSPAQSLTRMTLMEIAG